jgi:hypothetical protein
MALNHFVKLKLLNNSYQYKLVAQTSTKLKNFNQLSMSESIILIRSKLITNRIRVLTFKQNQ